MKLNRLSLIVLAALFTFVTNEFAVAAECPQADTALEEASRKVMEDHDLILDGEEMGPFPGTGFFTKWQVEKVVGDANDRCFVVMRLMTCIEGKCDAQGTPVEVLVIDSSDQVALFEDVVSVPEKMRASFFTGPSVQYPTDHYYAELEGAEAVALAKIYYGQVMNLPVFSGIVVRGKAPAFDLDPDRNWKVVDAKINLRTVGTSGEAYDVYPHDFDANLEAMFGGCVKEMSSQGTEGCGVIPYNGFLHEILD